MHGFTIYDSRAVLLGTLTATAAVWRSVRDTTELLCIHTRDGAWAEADPTAQHEQHTVTQGGPRQIWDQVEQTAARWSQLSRPAADRSGLTVT